MQYENKQPPQKIQTSNQVKPEFQQDKAVLFLALFFAAPEELMRKIQNSAWLLSVQMNITQIVL